MNIRLLISVLLLFMIAESSIYAMNPEEESPKIESYLELLPAETMTELFKFAISDLVSRLSLHSIDLDILFLYLCLLFSDDLVLFISISLL